MYSKTTGSIEVSVQPTYLDEQSRPEDHHYVWAYHVIIRNHSETTVTLSSRYWRITDAGGHIVEVEGEGVVGEQPILRPGESFEYTSGTPLATSSGIMTGNYKMLSENGEDFTVDIPAFSLDSPYADNQRH